MLVPRITGPPDLEIATVGQISSEDQTYNPASAPPIKSFWQVKVNLISFLTGLPAYHSSFITRSPHFNT